MKKTISFLCCFLIVLILCLPMYASAHPGGTDGKGGHTNRSTGEYHYHHGYSAHDHYDMNGDGVVDCPYDFKDKTGSNSGAVSSNKSRTTSSSNKTIASNSTSKTITSIQPKEEEPKVPTFIYWVIGILAFIILCLCLVIRGKNETIERNKDDFRRREKEEETKVREGLTSLHNALAAKYGKDYLYYISGAKEGDFVGEDGYPHSAGSLIDIGLDHYTFYLGGSSSYSSKYHRPSCRYARSTYPINAMYLQDRRYHSPCMLCSCVLPDTAWVQKYKKHHEFLKRYVNFDKTESQPRINHREQ